MITVLSAREEKIGFWCEHGHLSSYYNVESSNAWTPMASVAPRGNITGNILSWSASLLSPYKTHDIWDGRCGGTRWLYSFIKLRKQYVTHICRTVTRPYTMQQNHTNKIFYLHENFDNPSTLQDYTMYSKSMMYQTFLSDPFH
jgi:hypothetical protein